jgi:hypothetical protein
MALSKQNMPAQQPATSGSAKGPSRQGSPVPGEQPQQQQQPRQLSRAASLPAAAAAAAAAGHSSSAATAAPAAYLASSTSAGILLAAAASGHAGTVLEARPLPALHAAPPGAAWPAAGEDSGERNNHGGDGGRR